MKLNIKKVIGVVIVSMGISNGVLASTLTCKNSKGAEINIHWEGGPRGSDLVDVYLEEELSFSYITGFSHTESKLGCFIYHISTAILENSNSTGSLDLNYRIGKQGTRCPFSSGYSAYLEIEHDGELIRESLSCGLPEPSL